MRRNAVCGLLFWLTSTCKCGRQRWMIRPILALTGLLLSWPSHALIINATYTNLSPAVQAAIASTFAFYETTFTDPITVSFEFHDMSSGLGRNWTRFYFWEYQSYRSALIADATSVNDGLANATLGPGPNDPILNKQFITLKSANGRAVGLNTPGLLVDIPGVCTFTGDGCIGVNLAETTFGGGTFSLFSAVQHEINELLGLGSSLQPDGTITQGFISPEDMFRYASPGVRSFSVNDCIPAPPRAFLSIDGGATNVNEFNNCANGGDYGDWVTHTPSQLQDAFAGPGAPLMTLADTATIGLDVVGYTFAATPTALHEPVSSILIGVALACVVFVRSRVGRNRE